MHRAWNVVHKTCLARGRIAVDLISRACRPHDVFWRWRGRISGVSFPSMPHRGHYVAMLFAAGRARSAAHRRSAIRSIARATIVRRNERRNSMSVASPPDIDVCDGVQEDDSDNRLCHLINEEGVPYCGRVFRGGIGRIHPTNPFGDPCGSCGLRRCAECAELFLSSRF